MKKLNYGGEGQELNKEFNFPSDFYKMMIENLYTLYIEDNQKLRG